MTESLTFRCLKDVSEIDPWLDLLAECFKEKGTPREYFEEHWRLDPFAKREGIFVAIDDKTGKMVGSTRVFHRKIWIKGTSTLMGGIGEVATHPEYRQRGIAKILLAKAVEYMQACEMSLSVLSSVKYAAVYEKSGWTTVNQYYNLQPATDLSLTTQNDVSIVEIPISKVSDEVTEALSSIHSQFSPKLSGTMDREMNSKYWVDWVWQEAHKAGLQLHVAKAKDNIVSYVLTGETGHPTKALEVFEFGALEGHEGALEALLATASNGAETVKYSSALAGHVTQSANTSIHTQPGMMYRFLGSEVSPPNVIENVSWRGDVASTSLHAIWKADHF